jgi:hypothetical protein
MSAGKRHVRVGIGGLAVSHWWSCCEQPKPCTICNEIITCCIPDEIFLTLSGFNDSGSCDCSFAEGITFTLARNDAQIRLIPNLDAQCGWIYDFGQTYCGTWYWSGVCFAICYNSTASPGYRWYCAAGLLITTPPPTDDFFSYTIKKFANSLDELLPNCSVDGWTHTYPCADWFYPAACFNNPSGSPANEVTALVEYP